MVSEGHSHYSCVFHVPRARQDINVAHVVRIVKMNVTELIGHARDQHYIAGNCSYCYENNIRKALVQKAYV